MKFREHHSNHKSVKTSAGDLLYKGEKYTVSAEMMITVFNEQFDYTRCILP